MAGLTGLKPSASYQSLLRVNDNSNGVDGTLEVVTDGEGTETPLKISSSAVIGTPLYTYFGIDSSESSPFDDDIHHGIPFFGSSTSVGDDYALGSATSSTFNDTNPPTTFTISDTAHAMAAIIWYVIDDITVDAVHWFHGADAANGDTVVAHLMAYTINKDNTATSGNLSSGVVVADGNTISNNGREQVYYQSLTIQSANVASGSAIIFTFAQDTENSDYAINATVKYHLR